MEHSRLDIFLLRDGVQFQQLVHAQWLNLRVSIIHPTLSDMDYRIFTVRMCSVGLRMHKGTLVYGLVRRRFINVSSVSGRYNYSFMSQQITSGTGWLTRAHTHSRPRLTHARTNARARAHTHTHTHTHTQTRARTRTLAKHRCFVGPNDFPAPVFPNRKCDLNVKKNEYVVNTSGHYNRRLTQNVQW